ncbi:MAG: hypothetical protein B7Z44_08345 [Caulobacter sp. 12-67-6]|nr:MAG: hypothetical protein B7Z44_08345 [Caulobacter sp. 12-67-6]
MTQTTSAGREALAGKALGVSARLWIFTALAGQLAFALYVASFYGGAAVQGRFEAWNDVLVGGYVRGAMIGNIVLAAHLLLAVVITLGGPFQLWPWIRRRAPWLHRWNGRFYMLTAVVITLSGLYAVWTRGTAGGTMMRVGISLNGVLILVTVGRRFAVHRRWALRLFLLVSGVWFFRIGLMLWILVHKAPVGIGDDFDGPFVRFLAFGCYLVPLAVLELYFRAEAHRGSVGKSLMATLLTVLALCTAVGIFGAFMGMWLPRTLG